jgi:hypothetical protein
MEGKQILNVFLKNLLYINSIIAFALILGVASCGKEEIPIDISPLRVSGIEEQFDSESSLLVKASLTTTSPDTIASVGFIYSDAVDPQNPDPIFDHTVTLLTKVEIDDTYAPHTYSFSGLINPVRSSPLDYDNSRTVWIKPFVVSKSGKTYVGEVKFFTGDKVKILDLYPRHAAPGTMVKGTLNRSFTNGKFSRWSFSHSDETVYVTPFLVIGDLEISIEGDGSTKTFQFIMPDGLEEEVDVTLRVDDYRSTYDKKFKNTKRNFALLNTFRRDAFGYSLIFSSADAIYLGGGKNSEGSLLTDFWKYSIVTNQWTQIADYPSAGLATGMAFSIGNDAYCGSPDNLFHYDISANSWSSVPLPDNNLKYDHTFASASSVLYDGKIYFTNFSNKILGGQYWKNFWLFDADKETYTGLPDYPGTTVHSAASTYMDKGVAFRDRLHFVRALQHWTYNPKTFGWTRLADVSQDGMNMRIFGIHGELYGILTRLVPNGFLGTTGKSLTLYQYNDETDTWIVDADVPRVVDGYDINPGPTDFYLLQTSDEEVYFCQAPGRGFSFAFFKIK